MDVSPLKPDGLLDQPMLCAIVILIWFFPFQIDFHIVIIYWFLKFGKMLCWADILYGYPICVNED